jgi:hypothetical protein
MAKEHDFKPIQRTIQSEGALPDWFQILKIGWKSAFGIAMPGWRSKDRW